jgi:hypothetical protein
VTIDDPIKHPVISNTRATCPSRPILLDYTSPIVPTEAKKKLLIALFCNYLRTPTSLSLSPVQTVVCILLRPLRQKSTVLSTLIYRFKDGSLEGNGFVTEYSLTFNEFNIIFNVIVNMITVSNYLYKVN